MTQSRQGTFNRNRYYTLLKVGQRELGWDDEFYYGIWLPSQGAGKKNGRYSASTLNNFQLSSAVNVMRQQGFKVRQKADGNRKQADDGQSLKIRSLWLELYDAGAVRDSSETALAHFVKRQTGVDDLHWLDKNQASRVIEHLKKWLKRIQK